MKSRRSSKRKGYQRQSAPKPEKCIKRKEALNCIGRQKQKLIYRAAHRRGC